MALLFSSPVLAEAVVYLDEAAFLDAIAALGRTAYHGGFENEAICGEARSTVVGGQFTAPVISHQGIRWSANVVTTTHQFWGVIDEERFLSFEFRELEGKLGTNGAAIKYIFPDGSQHA